MGNQIRPNASKLSTKHLWFSFGIILLLSIGLYIQDLNYEYVLDDKIVITGNSFTKKGLSGIYEILTTESFTGYFGEQKDLIDGARYRPLSIITFAIEHQFFEQNRQISHLINILLYALSCFLLLVFFSEITIENNSSWFLCLAFIAAIIYTIHPLHTEAVANIKGRDEIMAFIFSISSILTSLRWLDSRKIKWLFGSFIFFLLGLLSKENTITFLAIIPLTICMFRTSEYKKIGVVFIPLFLATIIYFLMRYNAIGYILSESTPKNDIMNYPFANMGFAEKYATIFYTLGVYLKLNIFPHPLTHDYYPFHIPTMQWSDWQSIFSLVIHIGLGLFALLNIRKNKIYAFGILFYLICLSIVSNLFVSVGTFMNERFMFFSSAGTCLIFAKIITDGINSRKQIQKILCFSALGIILIGFSLKTFTRVPAWKSAMALNDAAVKVSTNSARVNSFMGTAIFNKIRDEQITGSKRMQMLDEAEIYIDKALSLYPEYGNANIMKTGVLTEHFKDDQNLEKLLAGFKKIAHVKPGLSFLNQYHDYLETRGYDSDQLASYYYDIGYNDLHLDQKEHKWAIKYLLRAKKIKPNSAQILTALSKAYRAIGMANEADECLYQAQQLNTK